MNKIISMYFGQTIKTFTFFIGGFLLAFGTVFLTTGYDEIWRSQGVWMYGFTWLLILLVNGLIFVAYSVGKITNVFRFCCVLNAVLFSLLGIALFLDV